jgi:hypothetical protein
MVWACWYAILAHQVLPWLPKKVTAVNGCVCVVVVVLSGFLLFCRLAGGSMGTRAGRLLAWLLPP